MRTPYGRSTRTASRVAYARSSAHTTGCQYGPTNTSATGWPMGAFIPARRSHASLAATSTMPAPSNTARAVAAWMCTCTPSPSVPGRTAPGAPADHSAIRRSEQLMIAAYCDTSTAQGKPPMDASVHHK